MHEKSLPEPSGPQQQDQPQNGQTLTPPPFQLKAGDPPGDEGDQDDSQGVIIQRQENEDKSNDAKAGDKEENKQPYRKIAYKSVIVTIPNDATGSCPILVIYGGLRYATREWMMTQVPKNYFSTHILVFANHGSFYSKSVGPDHKKVLKDEGVSGNYKALIGFSKGGYPAAKAKGAESWSVIGLIDPEITGYTKGFSVPVLMIWDTWYDNTVQNDPRARFHRKIEAGKEPGTSYRKTIPHKEMPPTWFSIFGSSL